MLEQVREAEIAQAVDRVRPVFNRRRIIVLTSLALDLTVDRALPWPELRPGKFAHAFARRGVLPLSAGDLAKAFPDLWPSENTAKVALTRSGLTGYKPQIIYSFGLCTQLDRPPLQARYRRQNQKGPAAQALIRADLEDPRAALEGLVGELVEFHLDRPPASPAEASARESAPQPLPILPPLVAALSAEGHLLTKLPPDGRPPDMLGMARVMKLMTLADELGGAQRAAVA
jgi:hypothetical protein